MLPWWLCYNPDWRLASQPTLCINIAGVGLQTLPFLLIHLGKSAEVQLGLKT